MGKIAYSNIDRVLLEINFLINKGVKKVRIVDANFTSNISYAKQLIRGFIKARFKLKVMFELIPGFIDEEFAYLLSQYNSIYEWNDVTIGVGVQTINLDVLKKIKRRIKIEKFELTFGLLQKYNIYTKIDLIIGLPGENIDSIERTLDYMMDKLMSSNSHLLCCHVMRGLPGTDLLDIAKEYDMVFSSEFEPHEFIESPLLPRCDMLTTLRRTAIIFRLVNHNGWSNKEFISGSDDDSVSIKDKFFCVKQCLEITNIDLVDLIVDGVSKYLEGSNSDYVKDDFPRAETWWWVYSKQEVPNSFILRYLDQLCRC